jgi:N-carbamoylputrescine amidase
MVNVFRLYGPDGALTGQVPKFHAETYFFRPVRSAHPYIDTPLGRIGVGICADNHYVAFARRMQAAAVDLMIMPHAWPGPTHAAGPVSQADVDAAHQYARDMAPLYARLLGVPALFVNQVGPMGAGPGRPPGILLKLLPPDNYRLLGLSAIAAAGGETVAALDDSAEGLALADVALDPARRTAGEPPDYDGWLHPGSRLLRRAIIPLDNALARLSYTASGERRRLARERVAATAPAPEAS